MTDYLQNANIDQEDMDPAYRQEEEAYRAQAAELWNAEQATREDLRAQVDLTEEERQGAYMAAYKDLDQRFEQQANAFAASVEERRQADKEKLEQGTSERFGEYLVSLSSKGPDDLPALMETARRTGQQDLAQAIAQTALEKGRYGVFEDWAKGEPQLADAYRRLRSTPDLDQLRTRALAMRPPKAGAGALEPWEEDHRKAEETAASQRAARETFFDLPRRFAGRQAS